MNERERNSYIKKVVNSESIRKEIGREGKRKDEMRTLKVHMDIVRGDSLSKKPHLHFSSHKKMLCCVSLCHAVSPTHLHSFPEVDAHYFPRVHSS